LEPPSCIKKGTNHSLIVWRR